jgi:hypothetical protein
MGHCLQVASWIHRSKFHTHRIWGWLRPQGPNPGSPSKREAGNAILSSAHPKCYLWLGSERPGSGYPKACWIQASLRKGKAWGLTGMLRWSLDGVGRKDMLEALQHSESTADLVPRRNILPAAASLTLHLVPGFWDTL